MKPKLIYNFITEQWRCEGDGVTEFGATPEQAYRYWRIERDYQAHRLEINYEPQYILFNSAVGALEG